MFFYYYYIYIKESNHKGKNMKNILSENLLRFGVKNLSESQRRALTLKTILETIDAHGLRKEVRNALTEADSPNVPNTVLDITPSGANMGDVYKIGEDAKGNSGPLVMQSPTSLKEASTILGQIMKLVGSGQAESPQMINTIKQITANNYPMILWKVRYGSTFKSNTGSNYNIVCDWLAKSVDKASPSAGGSSAAGEYSGGKGPIGAISDFFRGTKTAEAIESHLMKFNGQEYFRNY